MHRGAWATRISVVAVAAVAAAVLGVAARPSENGGPVRAERLADSLTIDAAHGDVSAARALVAGDSPAAVGLVTFLAGPGATDVGIDVLGTGPTVGGVEPVDVAVRFRVAGVDAGWQRDPELWWISGAGSPAQLVSVAPSGQVWDSGDVRVWRGPGVVLLSAGSPVTSAQVVTAASTALSSARRILPDAPRSVVLLLPANAAALARMVPKLPAGELAAAAMTVPTIDASAPDARIVVSPDEWRRLSPIGRLVVLRHELTHVATFPITHTGSPDWAVEGYADWVGFRGSGLGPHVIAAELAAHIRRGAMPRQLPGDAAFDSGGLAAAIAYEEAWSAFTVLAQGHSDLWAAQAYRILVSAHGVAAPGAALATVAGQPPAAFIARWQHWLRVNLG
jgi:hypothetical protein